MADGQHGGYRRPNNPAPVSGPGALSRRTDGRQPTRSLPNAKYGENAAFEAAQGAAPMSGDIGMSAGGPAPAGAMGGPDLSGLVPMDAATQYPDMPLESGLSGGAGAGPSLVPGQSPLTEEQKARLRAYLPVLVVLASRDDADPNTKQLVRQLRGDLG